MTESSPLRVLTIVTVRYAKNGVTGVVKNYASHISPDEAVLDYVLINEPTCAERAEIAARNGRIFVLPMRNRNPLQYMQKLYAVLCAKTYDAVHVHGNSATMFFDLLPAKRARVPARISHGHNTSCNSLLLHRLLSPPFSSVRTHGLACGREAGRFLYGNRPFTVLNNAVDAKKYAFDPEARKRLRAELSLPENSVLSGHVGTFMPRKNQLFAIEAFAAAKRRDGRQFLALVGDGETRPEAERLARTLGVEDAVFFLGNADNAHAFYSAFDRFLLPSVYEGLPLTLLEAQCAGLPCLVSETVTREAGVSPLCAFLPLDASAWTDALLTALPPSDRAEQSRAAGDALRKAGFDIVENAGTLVSFYRNALSGRRA